MHKLIFGIFLSLISGTSVAQYNWKKDFDIFLGIGLGAGKFDMDSYQLNESNKINHRIPSIGIEYSPDILPFSIDYQLNSSVHVFQRQNYRRLSTHIENRIGLGYLLNDKLPIQIKYIIRNKRDDIYRNKSHSLAVSIGIEKKLDLSKYQSKLNLKFIYRLMLFHEYTFGELYKTDNLTFNEAINSPFRRSTGVSIFIKPWITSTKKNYYNNNILPPFY